MLINAPFGIQVDFITIVVTHVTINGVVIKVHGSEGQAFQRRDLERDVLDTSIIIEGPGIITCHLTLEPCAIATARSIKQAVITL